MSTLEKLGYINLPGEKSSASTARAWVRGLLQGRMTTTALDDVVLLVSEVVTNAVVHSQSGREPDGQVSVYVARTPSVIHIEVTDGGSAITQPAMGAADPESDGGRGLWLVNLLATAWGTHQHDEAGAAVWFQVTAK